MIGLYFIAAIIGLELAAFGALGVYKFWTETFKTDKEQPQNQAQRKQEEFEKAWADGMSAISAYDINTARRAVRHDGEGEG